MSDSDKVILPSLRGTMGDWFYYVTVMKFGDIANRVSMADEIHQSERLSQLIQRQISNRTKYIVEYLLTQDQRFFNSLILGIYGGSPSWQDLNILENNLESLQETDIEYLNKTFGILTLEGTENIFAIDGQHRTKAIKEAIKKDDDLKNEEITAIFVAHKKSEEGLVRTRRLFSTLNRYAKPVSKSEIIALDEEDNCAIITRKLVDEFELFADDQKVLFNKNRSINLNNKTAFTNIIVLYDSLVILLTDWLSRRRFLKEEITGFDHKEFTKWREDEATINEQFEYCKDLFTEIIRAIPSLNNFFYQDTEVNRRDNNTSLLFRPVGQDIFFKVLKVGISNNNKGQVLDFFSEHDFSLNNPIWNVILYDNEIGRIKPEKTNQFFAVRLILMRLGYDVKLSEKYQEIYDNFGIDPNDL